MITSEKERSQDRILILKPIEGKHTLSSSGLVDNRILTGDNKLHAVIDARTSLWGLRYEQGGLPEPLKQKFTNFSKLYDFVKDYFYKRNIELIRVED